MNQEINTQLLLEATQLLATLQAQGFHFSCANEQLELSGQGRPSAEQVADIRRLKPALQLFVGNQQQKVSVDSERFLVSEFDYNEQPQALTPQQQQLLTLKNNYPHDVSYHIPILVEFDNAQAAEDVTDKLQQYLSDFAPAQLCFRRDDYQNYQLCGNALFFPTKERYTLTYEESLDSLLDKHLMRPFKLGESLLRFGLITPEASSAEGKVYGFVLCHHIIADGWSLGLLLSLSQMADSGNVLQQLDFEGFKRAKLAAVEEFQAQFWRTYLAGADLSPQLPAQRSVQAAVETKACVHVLEVPKSLQAQLLTKAQQAGVSLYTLMAFALSLSLYYFSRKSKVHFLTTYANREDLVLETCFDYMVESLLVHHELNDKEPLAAALVKLGANLNMVQEFADYPLLQEYRKFDDVSGTEHDLQVLFSYQNFPYDAKKLNGRLLPVTQRYCKSPMSVEMFETPDVVQMIVDFDEQRFAEPFREQWLAYWQYLLNRLGEVDFSASSINDILLSGAELKVSGGAVAKPTQTLAQYIVHHCAAFSSRIAVVDNDQKLTYEGLHKLTSRYHQHLVALFEDTPEQSSQRATVLVMRKSRHLMAFCLATNTAGGYYTIIDPADSDALIADKLAILSDAKIICDDINKARLRAMVGEREVLSVVNFADEVENDVIHPQPAHKFMYGVFSSGTTGKPKLARNYHHSMFHLVNSMRSLMPDDKSAFSLGSQGFDTSIKLFYAPLLSGHTLYLHHYDFYEPERILLDYAVSSAPTSCSAVAVLNSLLQHPYAPQCLAPLRVHINVGEHWNLTHVRSFGALTKDCTVINAYGPSETADIVLWSSINDSCIGVEETPYSGDLYVPPLQNAVPGSDIYIVDEQVRPMPANCKGQLLIVGECVGAGYSDPELSKKSFVTFAGAPGYLSGDIAQISTVSRSSRNDLPEVVIHGRIDDQIKINGVRVELSGLETQLQALLSPRKLAIRAFKDEHVGYFVVCYVQQDTPHGEPQVLVEISEFLEPLQQKIDAPLIPRFWIAITDLPLTTNGKLNRKALPELPLEALQRHMHQAQLSQQQDISVLQFVQTQLGIPISTEHDNLIMHGCDSIKMNRLKAHLEQRFSRRFMLASMYESPTLADILDKQGAKLPATSTPTQDKTQISAVEKQFLYLENTEASRLYQICGGFTFKKPIPQSKVKSALIVLLQQTEALRSQYDQTEWKKRLVSTDPSDWPENWCEVANTSYQGFYNNAELDLTSGFPVRFMLSINEETRVQQIWIKVHHIAVDEYSLSLICDRLLRILDGQTVNFDALEQWSQTDVAAVEDWRSLLDIPPITFRHGTEPQKQSHTREKLPQRHSARLESKAKARGCTEFAVMLAAFAASLSTVKSQQNVAIGVPISLRDTESLLTTVGCLINTLPARLHLNRDASFNELVEQAQNEMTRLQQVKYTPLVDIKTALNTQQDLFNVMLVKHDEQLDESLHNNEIFAPAYEFTSPPRLDLTLHYTHHEDGLSLLYEYDPRISETDISTLHQTLQSVLTQLEQGGEWLLRECQLQQSHYFKPATIAVPDFNQQLVEHALYQPDATALSVTLAQDDQVEEINYQHLQQDVIAFAQQLSPLPKGVISIVDESPLNVVLLQLAVLYSGNIFMVQNPNDPPERRKKLQDETECVAQISLCNHKVDVKPRQRLSPERQHQLAQQQANPKTRIAYVIVTSGTTGEPKAAAIRYESLCYSSAYRLDYYQKDLERVLLLSPLTFDSAYASLFGCLFSGGCVSLLDEQQRRDPAVICSVIKKSNITQTLTTPSFYQHLCSLPTFTAPLSSMILAGEALSQRLVNLHYKRFSQCALYNEYGPTENTIWSSVYRCQAGERHKFVPIGAVLPGVQAVVLDDQLEPVPYDQQGELYLAGDCLFAGYLNRPTEEAFKTVTAQGIQGEFYATGDLVCMDEHGDLTFESRRQNFIKIRGYRVSPNEVINCLQQVNWVREVQITNKNNSLIAIVRTDVELSDADKKRELVQKLRTHVQQKLPAYMLPQGIYLCNDFPLTPNGKVDLIQLLAEFEQEVAARQAKLPPLDEKFALQLKTLLGISELQPDANFFENGGNSIQLMELNQYIEMEYKRQIPITTLYQQPSLYALQHCIFEQKETEQPVRQARRSNQLARRRRGENA